MTNMSSKIDVKICMYKSRFRGGPITKDIPERVARMGVRGGKPPPWGEEVRKKIRKEEKKERKLGGKEGRSKFEVVYTLVLVGRGIQILKGDSQLTFATNIEFNYCVACQGAQPPCLCMQYCINCRIWRTRTHKAGVFNSPKGEH